jgi:hypothetical protein
MNIRMVEIKGKKQIKLPSRDAKKVPRTGDKILLNEGLFLVKDVFWDFENYRDEVHMELIKIEEGV